MYSQELRRGITQGSSPQKFCPVPEASALSTRNALDTKTMQTANVVDRKVVIMARFSGNYNFVQFRTTVDDVCVGENDSIFGI
mmetsp:Transcript_16232/g.44943  ORF Transcript_16232/g.44943 Transcript_16232/m.44943 type:complete len:83 (-) Transcript_16232:38-286(-)